MRLQLSTMCLARLGTLVVRLRPFMLILQEKRHKVKVPIINLVLHFGAILAVSYHGLPELIGRHRLQGIVHDYGFATRMNVQSSVDRLPEVIRGMVFYSDTVRQSTTRSSYCLTGESLLRP